LGLSHPVLPPKGFFRRIQAPRDGKGFKGFLPQLDEFYFTTGKKKISENAGALFRIS
jgi:hypothetical protein